MHIRKSSVIGGNRFLLIGTFCFLFFNFGFCQPDWVKNRPINTTYFIGIGVSVKDDSVDYLKAAKTAALNDLATEISVTISSELSKTITEQTGIYSEDFKSFIRATTRAELEGYELIDTWDDEFYWVYYRLSKEYYYKQRQSQIESAASLAADLILRSNESLIKKEPVNALQLMLKALLAFEKYLGEPSKVLINSEEVIISNYIFTELQEIIQRIQFSKSVIQLQSKKGITAKFDNTYSVFFNDNGNSSIHIPMLLLPLQIIELNSGNSQRLEFSTDQNGDFELPLLSLNNKIRQSQFSIQPDLMRMIGSDSTSIVLQKFLERLNIPTMLVTISLESIRMFITSNERNLGRAIPMLIIEPKVKDYLGNEGFEFVLDNSPFDFILSIEADTRSGSQLYGQYSAFATANISLIDKNTGSEIYKNSVKDEKGIQIDFEKAGLKALENASTKMVSEILPKLLEKISR